MPAPFNLLCILLLAGVAAGSVGDTTTASTPPDADQMERVATHVAEGLRANRVPGGALAIIDGNDEVYLRGFGMTGRDGEVVTPDTPFVIGSVSKSMTALAVLQLVEDGTVELDDPLVRHLDWFEVRPAAWSQQVTIRRLLEQTSGLPALAGAPATTWLRDLSIAETARHVTGTELDREPGTAWEYSNANYVLLGALIEKVTGRPYAEHLEERLFAPLGMTRTTARLDEARELGLDHGHRYLLGWPVAHLTFREGLVPAGLVVSSARDLSRYLQALLQGGQLDGERVLSAAGVDALFTPATTATLGPWAKQPAAAYGFGWFVGGTPFGPTPTVFHPGATPDFGATVALVPGSSRGLVLLVNVGPRVAVPGAAGDIDRIGAGAVSLLTGSEPSEAGTVDDAYRVATPVLVLLLLAAVVFAVRRPQVPGRPRRHLAYAAMAGIASLVLLALPTLGSGWRQSWLWTPDLTAVAALTGAAFAVAAGRRLLALRAVRRPVDPTPSSDVPPVALTTGR